MRKMAKTVKTNFFRILEIKGLQQRIYSRKTAESW